MERAAALFDELVVGVYDHRRPTKSILFPVEQRVAMIQDALGERPNVKILPYSGLSVDFAHEIGAKMMIRGLRVFSDFEFEFRFALANQRLAPDIENVNLMTREEHMFLSGSIVREIASLGGDVSSMVPPNVAQALHNWFHNQDDSPYQRPVPLRD